MKKCQRSICSARRRAFISRMYSEKKHAFEILGMSIWNSIYYLTSTNMISKEDVVGWISMIHYELMWFLLIVTYAVNCIVFEYSLITIIDNNCTIYINLDQLTRVPLSRLQTTFWHCSLTLETTKKRLETIDFKKMRFRVPELFLTILINFVKVKISPKFS